MIQIVNSKKDKDKENDNHTTTKKDPIQIPIYTQEETDYVPFVIPSEIRNKIWDFSLGSTFVQIPTKQLKDACLHLGSIKSLGIDENQIYFIRSLSSSDT